MGKRKKYERRMPHTMYTYFIGYSDSGVPSFSKFARSIGATLADIESWREHDEFDRAYRECNEIRRDYLIDGALGKRYDASTVKYLLTNEFGMEDGSSDEARHLDVTIEVVE